MLLKSDHGDSSCARLFINPLCNYTIIPLLELPMYKYAPELAVLYVFPLLFK